jgi:signal transduction histidine kinase/ActR/RegA family two-component response regulator
MGLETLVQVVDSLPEPAFLVSGEGIIIAANRVAAELTSISRPALKGKPLCSLVSDPPEKVQGSLALWSRNRQMLLGSLNWQTSGGTTRRISCEGAAVCAEPESGTSVILLRCTAHHEVPRQFAALNTKVAELTRDITERKRTELLQSGQSQVLELLAKGESLVTVLTALTQMLEQQMPGVLASILLTDESGLHLRHGAAPSLPAAYCQAIDGVAIGPEGGSCGTAAYRRERVVADDISTNPLWADYRELASRFGLRACTSQPIFALSGQMLGTVAIYNGRPPYRPAGHEIQLLEMTARLAGIAIERRMAEAELRRAKEAAESASKAKDQFLAVLSHELRTPLTPVVAAVSSLEQQPLPERILEDIGMIRRCVELETRLIDDLLDLTSVTRGKLQLVLDPIDAHVKVRNVIELCHSEAERKNFRLITELTAERHYVQGDSARLQQVFWNLIRNSIKFTPEGGCISIRSWNAADGQLFITVSDTGIGIDPEVLPHIFDPFEQGEENIARRFGGLGLGLAIAKAVVDLHGGELRAASEGKGRGATLTVVLDTVTAEEQKEHVPAPATNHPGANGATRLLLVEDHPDTAQIMSRLLKRSGHIVHVADSVAMALKVADAEDFDLLISDIGLPDGSGLDLMRQLRCKREVAGIVLSGFGMQEDVDKSKAAGFSEHLTKPVDFIRLEAAIARISLSIFRPEKME